MLATKVGVNGLVGSALIAVLTSVCSTGFCLFGYDQGVMSGVVVSKYWLDQMGNPSTIMVSTITALYDVGAFFGAIVAAFTAEPLGRKRTLITGATIVLIGAILMGSCVERIQMMVARIVAGFGVGYITSVTPVYQSEVTLPEHRGWQVCCQLTSMLGGLMLAYWINYGFYFHDGQAQWRFPLLFQCVFALYVILVTMFMPESPRWLMRHDPTPDRGILVLAKLRNLPTDHEIVVREAEEIQAALDLESKEEGSWADLFKDNGVKGDKRFYLSLGIQFMQQLTGINIVTYYAPTLFENSLGMSQEMSLFVGCWLQVWYLIASFATWYTIDPVGRRKLWISMAIGQVLVLVSEAICVAVNNSASSIAAVFFVFAYETCFTWGWMATVWVYPAEILPLKIRAKGAALAAAADFLGNFLVVEITPPALQNIKWRTYIIFAVFNVVNAAIVWSCYPETAGQTLESIDDLFRYDDPSETHGGVLSRFQWSMVSKAEAIVKRVKAEHQADASGVAREEGVTLRHRNESSSVEEKKNSAQQIENVNVRQ
ncbi:general substrate transporter [Laetiporus sulphureus 93-53]|uniref:General substrate transporter n=1 Tax=Laetiporus sulphureus 93-53 TaxID=1314785 RepID=A0A165DV51_9APHY|nr:general substrate transporter [Laetiporus sulphureus 93-53]KZT05688.1 general substrate transporter [Laetiporus sulphureus 93-53]